MKGLSLFSERVGQPKFICNAWLLPLVWLMLFSATCSGLDLNPIYADGMVVQQNRPIVVRGTGKPDEQVKVDLLAGNISTAPTLASVTTVTSANGQWEAKLPPQTPGNETLTLVVRSTGEEKIIRDIAVGDVWLCAGQSNMNFLMRPNPPWSEGVLDWENEVRNAEDDKLRIFTVVPEATHTPKEEAHGLWRYAKPEQVEYVSAVPYYFGKGLREATRIPVGIIVSALGGTSIREWSDPLDLQDSPDTKVALTRQAELREKNLDAVEKYYAEGAPKYRRTALDHMAKPTFAAAYAEPYKGWRYQPSGLFNAMIRPLDWFPIKGFVWYQGESDTTNSKIYGERLKLMIKSQRARRSEPELPFIVIQLANHDPVARGKSADTYGYVWANLREAQEDATSLPFTALVVTADTGHKTNIHPRDKKTVGSRCAKAALSLCYGSPLAASGPVLQSWAVEGSNVRLKFTGSNGGLVIDTSRATGNGPDFEIADSDLVYHPAQVEISDHEVILFSPQVKHPTAVRYAFHNDPKLILYDEQGLPARPFRREKDDSPSMPAKLTSRTPAETNDVIEDK